MEFKTNQEMDCVAYVVRILNKLSDGNYTTLYIYPDGRRVNKILSSCDLMLVRVTAYNIKKIKERIKYDT